MLNQSGVVITKLTTPNNILFAPEMAVAVSCIVDSTGISAGSDGKKIMKAGTPLSGDLTNRQTAFKKANKTEGSEGNLTVGAGGGTITLPTTASSNAIGILLHDVDVTSGKANASVLISGFVDMAKVDNTTAALITAEVKAALKGLITFMK